MDLESYFRFLFALILVIGLIVLLALAARRLGLGYRGRTQKDGSRRLSISEVMPLDTKRRLVLVRRDDKEHLLVLGPTSETVVERDIPAPDDSFVKVLTETNTDPSPTPQKGTS